MEKQNSNKSNNRGGKERRDDRPPREIVEITDEFMGKQLRKNFEAFVSTEKYNMHLNDHDEEEDEENKDEPKQEKKPRRHDFSCYRKLSENNGKKEAMMLHYFLIQVFELDKAVIEANLPKYLDNLSLNKALAKANFSEGISSFISMMPEMALDSPLLH
jgi:ABC-type Zn2+ transport system substrate-binding protein/surface adhesin